MNEEINKALQVLNNVYYVVNLQREKICNK